MQLAAAGRGQSCREMGMGRGLGDPTGGSAPREAVQLGPPRHDEEGLGTGL